MCSRTVLRAVVGSGLVSAFKVLDRDDLEIGQRAMILRFMSGV
jgi:hypothetical protein